MRKVLRDLKDRNRWTQAEVGRRLGSLTQQAASTILNKNGNFSRRSALKLAEMCGFDSPESLLSDIGKKDKKEPAAGGWAIRDFAIGQARRLGVEDEAIQRVVQRYGESRFVGRDAVWWMEKFIHEQRELEEERRERRRSTPPPPESEVPTAIPEKRRRLASGDPEE